MEPYFTNDSYQTPRETPRHWLDRLFLGSRLALHGKFVWEIVKARRLVAQNKYDSSCGRGYVVCGV